LYFVHYLELILRELLPSTAYNNHNGIGNRREGDARRSLLTRRRSDEGYALDIVITKTKIFSPRLSTKVKTLD
jgi:hypothetical protein